MKRLIDLISAAAVVIGVQVGLHVITPNAAAAQEPCYTAENCGPHYYTEFEWEQAGGNDRYKVWEGCDVCRDYKFDPIPFYFCSPPCMEDDGLTADQLAAKEQMLEGVRNGDLAAVVAAGASLPKSVAFNAQRESIQVISCSGTVVADLPITGGPAAVLAVREQVERGRLSLVAIRE